MATQASLYGEIVLPSGDKLAYCRRCGCPVADTGIHTIWHDMSAATAFPTAVGMTWPTPATDVVSKTRTA